MSFASISEKQFVTFESSNHLNSGQVWYTNGSKVSDCLMVWFLNGGLKTGQKMSVLWSKMSSIQMVRKNDKKVSKK